MNKQVALKEEVALQKHIELHQAILHIDSIVTHLDGLLCKLQGTKEEASLSQSPDAVISPTFEEVLNASPSDIRGLVEQAHGRIERIVSILF